MHDSARSVLVAPIVSQFWRSLKGYDLKVRLRKSIMVFVITLLMGVI